MDARASALSDLLLEWEERRGRGEPADPESICATHPDLLAPFRETVEKLLEWERLDPTGTTDLGAPPLMAGPSNPSVAGFTVYERVGEGTTSVVYRAEDVDTGLPVAVKVLRRPSFLLSWDGPLGLVQRFEQEARLLARLNHDGIVRIFLSRLQGSPPFFVMEYLPGGSLVEYAPRLRANGPSAVAAFVELVARAVGEAHRNEILHRDLKPSNILLDANGRPHVSDFGIAKLLACEGDGEPDAGAVTPVSSSLTIIDRQPGTLPYMAPEQYDRAFGPVGFATDVWALGVILYELLAGTRPFAAPEGAPRSAWHECVCRGAAPPLRLGRGHRRLARVVERCLEKDPARRYPDAEALANALRASEAPSRRRFRYVAFLAGALGLAAAAFLPVPQPPPSKVEPIDAYRTSTATALAALGRGEGVDFVPRVLAGACARSDDNLHVRKCPEGFTVEYNGDWALLEVLPCLPAGEYILRAELRHNGNSFGGEGDVGLYCWGSPPVARGERHYVIASLTFSDNGLTAARGARVITYFLGPTKHITVPFPPRDTISSPAEPEGWRQLTWQLSSEGAQATFDGASFRQRLTAGDFAVTLGNAIRAGTAAQIRPAGALGIYVNRSQLTVRRLRVTPAGK